ncbi:hypothetical protein [Chryseobacterium indoltheticum]|jgi:hypothetical protein|uniref:hypothetical protein n=1 Tax=Chryseobacterium indoltheticum TaxID=254 RepID=UPI002430395E|nr:hypothetical protein [Chryseobacterium indoltheticum]MDF2833023.1 hypothetical protein [Chryseobacterium indoltheticum]
MARKDEIFVNFLQHEILHDHYKIQPEDLPKTVAEGLGSEHIIVKAIAFIVENTEDTAALSDKALFTQITQFLNLSTYDH